MRLLLLSAIICLVLGSTDAQVRFNVNMNLGGQPVYGHSGYGHPNYYVPRRNFNSRPYVRHNYYPQRIRVYSNSYNNPYYDQDNKRYERRNNQNWNQYNGNYENRNNQNLNQDNRRNNGSDNQYLNQDNRRNNGSDNQYLNQDNRRNEIPDDRNLNQNNDNNQKYEEKENVTKDRYEYPDDNKSGK